MTFGIDVIFKIAAIGIIITVICQILKKSDRDDIATLVSLAGLIIVLTLVISMVSELFETVKNIFDIFGLNFQLLKLWNYVWYFTLTIKHLP